MCGQNSLYAANDRGAAVVQHPQSRQLRLTHRADRLGTLTLGQHWLALSAAFGLLQTMLQLRDARLKMLDDIEHRVRKSGDRTIFGITLGALFVRALQRP